MRLWSPDAARIAAGSTGPPVAFLPAGKPAMWRDGASVPAGTASLVTLWRSTWAVIVWAPADRRPDAVPWAAYSGGGPKRKNPFPPVPA